MDAVIAESDVILLFLVIIGRVRSPYLANNIITYIILCKIWHISEKTSDSESALNRTVKLKDIHHPDIIYYFIYFVHIQFLNTAVVHEEALSV